MGIKGWAKEHQAVLAVAVSILTLGTLGWAFLRIVFAQPTLSITVETTPLRMPSYMYMQLDSAIQAESGGVSDSSRKALMRVRGFLRDTRTFTHISLRNSSNASLSNVDLRVHYVRDVDGWALEGDALDGDERERLVNAVRFDGANAIITLRGIPRMPPKSTIVLYVWGDVSDFSLLGDERVTATYDGGSGRLVRQRIVRGLDAFIYDNAGLLVIVLLLGNVAVWNGLLHLSGKQKVRVDTGTASVDLSASAP